jgi:hypothetical protein
MAYARRLPPRYRDRSPILVSWWVLSAGILMIPPAISFTLQGKWWPVVVLAVSTAAAGLFVVARAVRLVRSEVMVIRAELLGAIRALSPADAWADRGSGVGYQLQVSPSGIPGLAAGVYLEEIDLDGVVTTPGGGWRGTARRYGILPWQPRVRVEIVEGPVPGTSDYGQGPPRSSALARVRQSWRARRAGLLFAEAAEVRQLAARLANAEPLD